MDSDNRSSGASDVLYADGYVSGPLGRPATWEDIVNLPDHFGAEILGGRLHYRAMTRWRHARSSGELYRQICNALGVGERSGWWILQDCDVDLGVQNWVRPDLLGIRRDHHPELPEVWPLRLTPDWVCEVLSPNNAHYDRGDKAEVYAQAGVPWYWIVDADEHTIEVLELVNGRWQVFGVYTDGALVGSPPLQGVQLAVSEIFTPKGS